MPRKGLIMWSKQIPRLTFVLVAGVLGVTAQAQVDAGKTREQVRDETLAAIRDGDVMEPSGLTMRQIYPGMYPAKPVAIGRTRDEVVAETLAAIHYGDLGNVTGDAPRVMFPDMYPAAPVVAGKTRDEVRAELAQAERNGDVLAAGQADLTLREEFPQRYSHQ